MGQRENKQTDDTESASQTMFRGMTPGSAWDGERDNMEEGVGGNWRKKGCGVLGAPRERPSVRRHRSAGEGDGMSQAKGDQGKVRKGRRVGNSR